MRRGPLYMVLAALLFTVMAASVKVAREELSALEVMVFRAATAIPLSFALGLRRGLGISARRDMALRGVLGFGAMTCYFFAAKGLALADLSILSKLQPIVVALIAPIILGHEERSGRYVWGVLVVGLLGCVVLVGPDLAVGNVYGLVALVSALLSAGAHVMVRSLRNENAMAVVFWFQMTTLVLAIAVYGALEGELVPLPPAHLWPALLVTGVAATLGQAFMTRAYALDRASVIAAAGYAAPAWSAVVDLALFGTWPSVWALLGGALVVGAGLALVMRKDESEAARAS